MNEWNFNMIFIKNMEKNDKKYKKGDKKWKQK